MCCLQGKVRLRRLLLSCKGTLLPYLCLGSPCYLSYTATCLVEWLRPQPVIATLGCHNAPLQRIIHAWVRVKEPTLVANIKLQMGFIAWYC